MFCVLFSVVFSICCVNKNIAMSLSAEEEVEELELELHSRLLMLCKEHLIELFDKFEISKETLQNNTRLQLAKLLFSAVEKELGKLKTEEIIPYLLLWEDSVYVVVRRSEPTGAVYEVEREDGSGRRRTLHRNLLLPCPYLPSESNQNLQPKSQRNNKAPVAAVKDTSSLGTPNEADTSVITDDDHRRFSPHQVDRILKHLDSSSLVSDVRQSDTSDNIQCTPREQAEFVAPVPSNEPAREITPPQSEQTMPQSRPQRTRQPPDILSYYSLGQPISSHARISSVNVPEYPRHAFPYEMTNIQSQNSQNLYFAHGPSVYNEPSQVFFVAQGPFGQYVPLGSFGSYIHRPMPTLF